MNFDPTDSMGPTGGLKRLTHEFSVNFHPMYCMVPTSGP